MNLAFRRCKQLGLRVTNCIRTGRVAASLHLCGGEWLRDACGADDHAAEAVHNLCNAQMNPVYSWVPVNLLSLASSA